MPEGDTVWRAGRSLDRALSGRPLTVSDFRVPQLATADLTGRTVGEVVSRGKHLLTRIEGGLTLHTHLRMDGSWRLFRTGERWRGGPGWQVRLVLANDEWQAVGYRMPVVELLRTRDEHDVVGHLGPDLLGPDWDRGSATDPAQAVARGDWVAAEAVRRLDQQGDRQIGEALLDQRNLAGIGNLYRAETLFIAGVHPRTPVGGVPDLMRVVGISRELLLTNRDRPAQITTGDTRRGHEHFVYRRTRLPCRRCGTAIASEQLGPPTEERQSYWCPTCQPGPA